MNQSVLPLFPGTTGWTSIRLHPGSPGGLVPKPETVTRTDSVRFGGVTRRKG